MGTRRIPGCLESLLRSDIRPEQPGGAETRRNHIGQLPLAEPPDAPKHYRSTSAPVMLRERAEPADRRTRRPRVPSPGVNRSTWCAATLVSGVRWAVGRSNRSGTPAIRGRRSAPEPASITQTQRRVAARNGSAHCGRAALAIGKLRAGGFGESSGRFSVSVHQAGRDQQPRRGNRHGQVRDKERSEGLEWLLGRAIDREDWERPEKTQRQGHELLCPGAGVETRKRGHGQKRRDDNLVEYEKEIPAKGLPGTTHQCKNADLRGSSRRISRTPGRRIRRAPFGRVQLLSRAGNSSGALAGLGCADRRKPAEQQPRRGRDERGRPEPKTRQRPLPKVCKSHLGNANAEDGQRCDSEHQPRHCLGLLAGKHGDEGRCDHERLRHPAWEFSQAQERAVTPKIAGNPFAFALNCARQAARATRRTARVQHSITPTGAVRSCRLCSQSRSWFVGPMRSCRAT